MFTKILKGYAEKGYNFYDEYLLLFTYLFIFKKKTLLLQKCALYCDYEISSLLVCFRLLTSTLAYSRRKFKKSIYYKFCYNKL